MAPRITWKIHAATKTARKATIHTEPYRSAMPRHAPSQSARSGAYSPSIASPHAAAAATSSGVKRWRAAGGDAGLVDADIRRDSLPPVALGVVEPHVQLLVPHDVHVGNCYQDGDQRHRDAGGQSCAPRDPRPGVLDGGVNLPS